MASEILWTHYHQRWHAIEREWRAASWLAPTIRYVIAAARDELRAEIRLLAPKFPGSYLIPL